MDRQDRTALIPRAKQVYRHLADGEYESIGRQMTFLTRRSLNKDRVMDVWSEITSTAGTLQSLGDSFVRPSGASAVVETPLTFETQQFVGRIAYNRRHKIVGVLILPPDDVPTAPF